CSETSGAKTKAAVPRPATVVPSRARRRNESLPRGLEFALSFIDFSPCFSARPARDEKRRLMHAPQRRWAAPPYKVLSGRLNLGNVRLFQIFLYYQYLITHLATVRRRPARAT